MELRTLTKRIAENLGVDAPEIKDITPITNNETIDTPSFESSRYDQVSNAEALQTWINTIYDRGWVAVDTETTGLNEMTAQLVGISLAVEPGHACYIPLTHKIGGEDLFGSDKLAEEQMPIETALKMLAPILEE